jgi:MMP 1-O-methyltransferase
MGGVVAGAAAMQAVAAEHDVLEQHLRGVPGWLSDEEATALYELAKGCTGRGVIVEIGSFKGRSTICLGLGSQAGQGVPIYAIDPGHGWKRFAEFQANIRRAGIEELVRPIAAMSADAYPDFPEPAIELLFIDGSHRYDLVDLDFHLWTRKLVDGGMLAMHDTSAYFPGSCRVAEEQMYKGSHYRRVRFIYSSMTVGQKVRRVTVAERAANRASLLVKRSFDVAVRVRERIPDPVKRTGRRGLRAIQRRPGG